MSAGPDRLLVERELRLRVLSADTALKAAETAYDAALSALNKHLTRHPTHRPGSGTPSAAGSDDERQGFVVTPEESPDE